MINWRLGHIILNAIGGTARWVFGMIWRTLFNKNKYTYKEYLHGPKDPDYYDTMGHGFNNRVIGLLVFVAVFWLVRTLF